MPDLSYRDIFDDGWRDKHQQTLEQVEADFQAISSNLSAFFETLQEIKAQKGAQTHVQ